MVKLYFFLFISLFSYTGHLFAQNWETLESGTDYILFDMSIPPGQNDVIYAAGMQYTYDAEGVIIKSIDGGENWQQIVSGANTPGFEAICFTSTEVGYVGGWDGYFAKTTDGGISWETMTAGSDNWFFMDIEFFDEFQGIALANLNSGGSGIYRTSNSGESWTETEAPQSSIQDVSYATASTLYAVGSNEEIYRSYNGGNTWEQKYSGVSNRFFMGVDFNGDFGVVGGEDGKIFSTIDDGDNWSSYATGYHNFYGVHVFDTDSAFIGGTDEDIYKTLDSGNNWEVEDNGSGSSHIYKVKFADDGTGFLCGSQGMIKRKQVFVALQSEFSGEAEGCNWQIVNFFDESTGFIETWEWTFTGPATYYSTEKNPELALSTAGIYDVKLKVSGWEQQDSITKMAFYESHVCPGLEENRISKMKVYPNPAKNILFLEGIEEEALIRIVDITGKVVLSGNTYSQIDISHLAEGSYLIQIETDKIKEQQTLIIQK